MGAHRTKRAPGRVRGASSRCVGMGWYLVHGTERAGSDLLLEREDLVDVVIVEEVVQVVGDRHRGGAVWRVGLLARSHTHTHVYTASSSRRDATTTLYARSQELRRLSRSSSPPRVRCNQREELRTHTHAPTRNRATTTAAVAAAVAVARAGERQTTSATRRQAGLSAYSASASGSAAPRRCSTSRRRRSLFAALLLLCALLSRCALDFAVFPF